jgi:hypothetical protein
MHVCDNPKCVNIDHLVLGTQSENKLDAKHKGRIARGDTHGMSKVSDEDVLTIRRLRSEGMTLRELGLQFGTCQSNVSQICRRITHQHV